MEKERDSRFYFFLNKKSDIMRGFFAGYSCSDQSPLDHGKSHFMLFLHRLVHHPLSMIHGGRALHPKLDGPLTAEFVRNIINFAILFILYLVKIFFIARL